MDVHDSADNFGVADEEEIVDDVDRYAHCFSFQYDDEVVDRQEANVVVSQKHCIEETAFKDNFEKVADTHMVEIGTSSIVEVVSATAGEVCYADESFIAANFNQHEETMFDDDITSALLNGIGNNAAHNMSNQFIASPRDHAMEYSITAIDGSNLD